MKNKRQRLNILFTFIGLSILILSFQNCAKMQVEERSLSSATNTTDEDSDQNSGNITEPEPQDPIVIEPTPQDPPVAGNLVVVKNTFELIAAIQKANPGDWIELQSGVYNINSRITITRNATKEAPIVLRAKALNTVFIESCTQETFNVQAAYWIFENLNMSGLSCLSSNHHAFHIVYPAQNITLKNNRISDYGTHVKTNGIVDSSINKALFPDNIQFYDNYFLRTRATPISPANILNLDGGKNYVIKNNVMSGFARTSAGRASGVYAKTEIESMRVENNLIVCNKSGQSVSNTVSGINLGEGTGSQYCPQCIASKGQVKRAIIRNNIIMNCQGSGNSNGLTVEKDEESRIYHNTFINTKSQFYSGLDIGSSESIVQGNLFDTAFIHPSSSSKQIPSSMQYYQNYNLIFSPNSFAVDAKTTGNLSALSTTNIIDQGKEYIIKRNLQASDKVELDFCHHSRDSKPDLGAIEYSNSKSVDCLKHIIDLYNGI